MKPTTSTQVIRRSARQQEKVKAQKRDWEVRKKRRKLEEEEQRKRYEAECKTEEEEPDVIDSQYLSVTSDWRVPKTSSVVKKEEPENGKNLMETGDSIIILERNEDESESSQVDLFNDANSDQRMPVSSAEDQSANQNVIGLAIDRSEKPVEPKRILTAQMMNDLEESIKAKDKQLANYEAQIRDLKKEAAEKLESTREQAEQKQNDAVNEDLKEQLKQKDDKIKELEERIKIFEDSQISGHDIENLNGEIIQKDFRIKELEQKMKILEDLQMSVGDPCVSSPSRSSVSIVPDSRWATLKRKRLDVEPAGTIGSKHGAQDAAADPSSTIEPENVIENAAGSAEPPQDLEYELPSTKSPTAVAVDPSQATANTDLNSESQPVVCAKDISKTHKSGKPQGGSIRKRRQHPVTESSEGIILLDNQCATSTSDNATVSNKILDAVEKLIKGKSNRKPMEAFLKLKRLPETPRKKLQGSMQMSRLQAFDGEQSNPEKDSCLPSSVQKQEYLSKKTKSAAGKLFIGMPKGQHKKMVHKCDVCGKVSKNKFQLIRHMRTHTGEKPFECDICHEKFSASFNCKVHRRVHTSEKPYECDICHKNFTRSSDFRKHQRTHTGEKPFECQICHEKFSQSGSLKTHQLVHTGERPFECEICYKTFSHKSTLQSHLLVHSGERPFKCDICNRIFTLKASLYRHYRRQHFQQKL